MNRFEIDRRQRAGGAALVCAAAVWALAGCSHPVQTTTLARPVRVAQVSEAPAQGSIQLAGEIKARYEARVGFRVAGKLLARHVNVGDRVKAGSPIADLDPDDYRLALDAIAAQLSAAEADSKYAAADRERYRELLAEKLIGPAEYERRDTTADTLRERVATLKAQLQAARNQLQYTQLKADHDAIVVAVLAEAGQVVAAGQPVVVLARPEELEVAVDVPEQLREQFAQAKKLAVSIWAKPGEPLEGEIRELAASADPASRTFAARISLPHRPAWLQLGMSATLDVAGAATEGSVIPLSAVFHPQAQSNGPARVWRLNQEGTAVSSVPVRLGAPAGIDEIHVKGLAVGERIVTAGASRLAEGQAVRVLDASGLAGPALERK